MKFRLLYLTLFFFAFQSVTHAQLHLKVNGKLNLQNDNGTDSPQNGDIRWNQAANNGVGDFEGYIDNDWCSLTTKIKSTCDSILHINGIVFFSDVLSIAPGSYLEECNCELGVDDDGDGLIDCADPDCATNDCCTGNANYECSCNDGIDNDGNGLIDCDDVNLCHNHPCCNTPFLECYCNDGIDNDGDGDTDCNDNDCCVVLPTVCQCN